MLSRIFLATLMLASPAVLADDQSADLNLDVEAALLLQECCGVDAQAPATRSLLTPEHSPVAAQLDDNLDPAFGKGGLRGFVEDCAELEVVPLKTLQDDEDRQMMIGVNFDGVLGLYVFGD